MPLQIVRNDITRMQVDIIVNAANRHLSVGSGVCGAIHKAAGPQLERDCRLLGGCPTGSAVVTAAYALPCQYVIHAVGPIWQGGHQGEPEALRSCYRKSLELAVAHHCQSIAFPLIATGGFGYPKEEGMRIAVDEINAFLFKHSMFIYLVVFDRESPRLGQNLYPDLKAYIDQNYVSEKIEKEINNNMDLDIGCIIFENADRYFSSKYNAEFFVKWLNENINPNIKIIFHFSKFA